MPLEIERKFHVRQDWQLPPGAVRKAVRQGYLSPEGAPTEVRVRATDDRYVMTVKAPRSTGQGGPSVRAEVEFPVSKEVFDELWELAPDRIDKERWTLTLDGSGAVATVDVYAGAHIGLRVVEVEFDSVEAADAFEPPAWFGEDVSGRPEWGNRHLARGSATV
ncbi:CYTH domain-containing protein [Streptomyces sp. NBC_00441]|uniref:CYTH domain-containing protein n=1 Tax=Streptomyces sp. NBC_00441 TaxID=2975742 RepID=UPI002E2C669C|nr:CYTH domain-containing protein [Streptomyces sp. NBC_00441]